MKKLLLLVLSVIIASFATAQNAKSIKVADGEFWWGGVTISGKIMPFSIDSPQYNLARHHHSNQGMPFLVSNKGRYIWCDEPFTYQFVDGTINITEASAEIIISEEDKTLKDAFRRAAKRHFPSCGTAPEDLFFAAPQYNTWIELIYNQNQEDILKYARAIKANGYPAGVLMIDDNWQRQYGNYDFRAEKFPDPKAMIDELHEMGFKVMLWISPFVSADGAEFRELQAKGYLLKQKNGKQPAILKWWNGYSAAYDLTNPKCYNYLRKELKRLQTEYGVDGYKFDAGDPHHYASRNFRNHDNSSNAYLQTENWARLGCEFEYNEFRASWKAAGKPLVQRLYDKLYDWKELPVLITDMLNAGITGHAYTCPDMIGGGQFKSFLNIDFSKIDQELIIRSCQIHALMPMMQFSVAPWRILDAEHNAMTLKYALMHQEYSNYILQLAKESSHSGEPIVRYMEYEFPNQGFEKCNDQFMLGNKYIVAPMVTKGYERSVKLPKGTWVDENGKTYKGGKSYQINVPIDRLPIFTRK